MLHVVSLVIYTKASPTMTLQMTVDQGELPIYLGVLKSRLTGGKPLKGFVPNIRNIRRWLWWCNLTKKLPAEIRGGDSKC